MLNNVMDKVKLSNSRHPKARFNLSHDVNSTYQFGEVQPIISRLMLPDEKDVVDIESEVRMAPLVAPTFGRIKHKEWHHFIPMTDLFPHFGNFMATTSYKGSVPLNLPHMSLYVLSCMCLVGSKMTIYCLPTGSKDDVNSTAPYLLRQPSVSQTSQDITNELSHLLDFQNLSSPDKPFKFSFLGDSTWNTSEANSIDLKYILDILFGGGSVAFRQGLKIPVANFDTNSWFDYVDKSVEGSQYSYVTDLESVGLDVADAVIPVHYATDLRSSSYYLAFRFSNFGKRLYKILVGLGYQLDFTSNQKVNLLPIFAFFKAWYDSFGLTRYKSWTDTYAYKLLNMYDIAPTNANFDGIVDSNVGSYYSWSDWVGFIVELGNTWVTEDVDYVTAHTSELPITPASGINAFDGSLFDGHGVANLSSSYEKVSTINALGGTSQLSQSDIGEQPKSGVTRAPFSALDIKELLKLYKWCNRNTIAGREIEKLLQAQGYGYYLYSCKSNFIGYTEQNVQIYDVVNNSDTYNAENNQGMLLGEYAGRGLSIEKSKSMSFSADEHGYWIGLCAIVPQSGYSQGLDYALTCIDKYSQYNPEFDGLGFEVSPKSVVVGSLPFADGEKRRSLQMPFGFIPRYSGFKVQKNISNGGFSLRSQRKVFQPYMLDKVIDVGERAVSLIGDTSTRLNYRMLKLFPSDAVPEAGDYWRFLGRYGWLGDLERIFARVKTNSDNLAQLLELTGSQTMDSSYEYIVTTDDNFMIHHIVNQQAYAPMLPISDSFGTEDDETGSFNDSMEQA